MIKTLLSVSLLLCPQIMEYNIDNNVRVEKASRNGTVTTL
jgi:hypothetical protein